MKKTTKLTVEFPENEYVYLKTTCAHKHMSIKDFVIQSVMKSIEDYENEQDLRAIEEARKDIAENGTVSWEEVQELLGLNDDLPDPIQQKKPKRAPKTAKRSRKTNSVKN